MQVLARRFRVRLLAVVVGALVAATALSASPSSADEAPLFLGWSDLLPSFTTGFEPSSANDCKAGRIQCVDSVIREMDKRFEPLADACNHNSMFALTYLRTTEEYRRSATAPGFFTDPAFINHQDAVGHALLRRDCFMHRRQAVCCSFVSPPAFELLCDLLEVVQVGKLQEDTFYRFADERANELVLGALFLGEGHFDLAATAGQQQVQVADARHDAFLAGDDRPPLRVAGDGARAAGNLRDP